MTEDNSLLYIRTEEEFEEWMALLNKLCARFLCTDISTLDEYHEYFVEAFNADIPPEDFFQGMLIPELVVEYGEETIYESISDSVAGVNHDSV